MIQSRALCSFCWAFFGIMPDRVSIFGIDLRDSCAFAGYLGVQATQPSNGPDSWDRCPHHARCSHLSRFLLMQGSCCSHADIFRAH